MDVYCVKGQEHLTTHDSPVITGKVYEVVNVSKCKCGIDIYDVGLVHRFSEGTACHCGHFIFGTIAWKRANRFTPLDDIDISELVELTEEILV